MRGETYVWTANGKNVQVHLSLELVKRLNAMAVDAFRVSPTAAGEIAGLLYGRVSITGPIHNIFVDEFVTMDPLPASLRASRHRRPVGLFRSRPRGELKLDRSDAGRIESLFKKPDLVYLLLQPEQGAPTRAGIFIEEGGRMRGFSTYREFPFDATLLRTNDFSGPVEKPPAIQSKRKSVIAAGFVFVAVAAGSIPLIISHRSAANDQPLVISPAGPDVPPTTAPSVAATVKIEPVLPERARVRRRFTPPEPLNTDVASLGAELPVDLKLRIDKSGRIARVRVVNGSPAHQLSARDQQAIERWRFKPARQSRRPVESEVLARLR